MILAVFTHALYVFICIEMRCTYYIHNIEKRSSIIFIIYRRDQVDAVQNYARIIVLKSLEELLNVA